MFTRPFGLLSLVFVMPCVAAGACTTDHDALARQPRAASGGQGGRSGASATAGFATTAGTAAQGGAAVNPDTEPPGDDVVTLVNGVVDASSVALCFASAPGVGDAPVLLGTPSPELSYGATVVVTELDGVSFAEDAIEAWVIAGTLSLIEGLDCEAAVALAEAEEARVTPVEDPDGSAGQGAGGQAGAAGEPGQAEPPPQLELPELRARALPLLPAGTFAQGRSVLLVLSGCLGGAAFSDPLETAVCGEEYTPKASTLRPVVVKLSRQSRFDKVGLQGVQGSLAAGALDLRIAGGASRLPLAFASDLTFGGIEPRPADVRFGSDELGFSARAHGVQAVAEADVLFKEDWASLGERAGVSALENGRNYSLALVGPSPRVLKPGFWNAPLFVLIDNDPTRR